MRRLALATAFAITLSIVSPLRCQENVPLFPLKDVRPGLKGVGRTIFEGDKIQEFQVEVLGVLKNLLSPKRDVILARLSGGPLEKTGVILGMSGSPVYIDGKLMGAVALAFPFAKEPLAGITPIENMLEVVPDATAPTPTPASTGLSFRFARSSADAKGLGRLIPDEDIGLRTLKSILPPESGSDSPTTLRLPLALGGIPREVVQTYTPLFHQMGLEPMQGGVVSAAESGPSSPAEIQPGSMISLLFMRGDLDLAVDCTVTYRRGDSLYACGHRVFLTGPAQIPFAPSHVLVSVPSVAISFKLDAPGQILGTIRQDRSDAIYGEVGRIPRMIPVHINVASTLNRPVDYHFDIVQETFLSPLLLNIGVASTLMATERMLGPSTLELDGKIRLSDGEAVKIEDVVSGDANAPSMAAAVVSSPLTYLLAGAFPDLQVEGIDLSIVARNEKRVAILEQVWSTRSEVRPGDRIDITALLRTPGGQSMIQKIPVQIPESVRNKTLSVVVGSGSTINALQFFLNPLVTTPRDLHQLVRGLNRMRRDNRLYALLMAPERSIVLQGDVYPSPPPSLLQTFLADPAISSSVIFSGTSVIGDFETKSSPYAIRGQKMLVLKVAIPET